MILIYCLSSLFQTSIQLACHSPNDLSWRSFTINNLINMVYVCTIWNLLLINWALFIAYRKKNSKRHQVVCLVCKISWNNIKKSLLTWSYTDRVSYKRAYPLILFLIPKSFLSETESQKVPIGKPYNEFEKKATHNSITLCNRCNFD